MVLLGGYFEIFTPTDVIKLRGSWYRDYMESLNCKTDFILRSKIMATDVVIQNSSPIYARRPFCGTMANSTLVNVKAPVVATRNWWWLISALVVA